MNVTRPTFAPVRWFLAACVAVLLPLMGLAADKLPPKYPFTKPPLQLLDEVADDVGIKNKPSADERKALTAVWEQKVKTGGKPAELSDAALIDLFLFASGVDTPSARKKYRQKMGELRNECGELLDVVTEPAERGDTVLRYVHVNLPKGYVGGQTSVSKAFDDGNFNCVSVSALTFLVGTHHGLDLRPMIVSPGGGKAGHAYLEWVSPDGRKRLVVEGTRSDGFGYLDGLSTAERKRATAEMGYARGREVDAAGLAGGIYFNRAGVGYDQRPNHTLAVRHYLCALAVNPADPDSAACVLDMLGGRAVSLAQSGEGERAVRLIRVALEQAPNSPVVQGHARRVFGEYVKDAYAGGNDAEVARRVKEAHAALPDDATFATPAAWYAAFAGTLGGKSKVEAGLEVFDRGLKAVDGEQREWLQVEREKFTRRWASRPATDELKVGH